MRGAARDIDAGGTVARLFDGVPVPPRSVPALRLLAALHYLVLSGEAPELAAFYPSVGGTRGPEGVWPVALAALDDHAEQVKPRLTRTVQTNDPGRSTVLYAALLWLSERHGLPIRLLELGASAGLNLHVDRFAYRIGDVWLGDPGSPVRFVEPWARAPQIDVAQAAGRLDIAERSGCDLAPLDPLRSDDRLTLLSYIWPDEPERLERTRAAMELAAEHPTPVSPQPAGTWLTARLGERRDGVLTVVWHSIFQQYVAADEWEALRASFRVDERSPMVWLSMEPGRDHLHRVRLTLRGPDDASERLLAHCGDHGPPLTWE